MKKTGWRELRKRLLALGIAAVMIGNTVDLSVLPVLAQEQSVDAEEEKAAVQEEDSKSEKENAVQEGDSESDDSTKDPESVEESSDLEKDSENAEKSTDLPADSESTEEGTDLPKDPENSEETTEVTVSESEEAADDDSTTADEDADESGNGNALVTTNMDIAVFQEDETSEDNVVESGEKVAKIGDIEYTSLPAALEVAKDGDTITLLADHTTDKNAVEGEDDFSTLAVVTKTLTLDLNGKKIDYLMVGEPTYGEENEDEETIDVSITSGGLTVTDNSTDADGSIAEVAFMSGTLNIQGGIIGKRLPDGSVARGIDCAASNAGENITSETRYGGKVTISGGTVYGLTAREDNSVTVTGGTGHEGVWSDDGGTLTIEGGEFGTVTFSNNVGTIAISGGMFGRIIIRDASSKISLLPLLANGYAFYDKDNSKVKDGAATILENVEVKEHTHTIENGKCVCGATFVASVTSGENVSYYTTLEEAFKKADWYNTVKLLVDVELTNPLSIVVDGDNGWVSNLTLDLNGKTISCTSVDTTTIFASITLTICDSSNDKTGKITKNSVYAVQAGNGGTLIITSGTFEAVGIFGGAEISGGTFSDIWTYDSFGNSTTKLCDVLKKGYVFADKDNPTNIVNGYDKNHATNVTVVEHTCSWSLGTLEHICEGCGRTEAHKWENGVCTVCSYQCLHESLDTSAAQGEYRCGNCHADLVAEVKVGETITYTADLAYTLNNAENGALIKLLSNAHLNNSVSIVDTDGKVKSVTLDLNGHDITGYSIAVGKRYIHYTQPDIESPTTLIVNGNGDIRLEASLMLWYEGTLDLGDWTGGTISTVTAARNRETLKESKLIVGEQAGCIEKLLYYSWPSTTITNSKLYGGSYAFIDSVSFGEGTISLADLLPDGYVFQKEDGTLMTREEVGERLSNVKVVKCDHGGVDGFAVDADTCPYCGASAVAQACLREDPNGDNLWRRFADLQTALDAERSGSCTLSLLANVTGDYTIDGTQTTGMDLNGYSINGTVSVNKAAESSNASVTFSNSKAEGSINKVVAFSGAKLAGSGAPAIINTLELASGATWENILQQPTRCGYKVYDMGGTDKWYDKDTATGTSLTDVTIGQLPITSKTLNLYVDGTKLSSNKAEVERDTTVQLRAYCNTSGAAVTFYIEKTGGDTISIPSTDVEYKKISTAWYYVADYKFDEIGSYEIYFSATKDGYTVQSSDKTLIATKTSIPADQITPPTAINNLTYNGSEQLLINTGSVNAEYGVMQYSLDKKNWNTSVPAGTDAKTYTVYYKVVGNDNYKDSDVMSLEVTIAPMKIDSVIINSSISKAYDGAAGITRTPEEWASILKFSSVSADNISIPETAYAISDARFVAKNSDGTNVDSPDAGTKDGMKFTVTFTNSNYALQSTDDTASTSSKTYTQYGGADFTITKAPAPNLTTTLDLYVTNNLEKTYEVDLTQLLPTLTSPCEYGEITYGAPSIIINTGYYTVDTAKVENGKLSLPINAVNSSKESSIGTVTVHVDSTNYETIELTIPVNARNKLIPVLDGTVSASDITYGQTLSESKITGTMKDNQTTGEEVSGTFTWEDSTVKPSKVGIYQANWIFTPDAPEYATVTGIVTVKVNQAQFTDVFVKQNGTLTYNGQPQTASVTTSATSVDGSEGIFGYSLENKIGTGYSKVILAFTEAGEHTVYYIVYEVNYNHDYFKGEFTVTIEPKTVNDPTIELSGDLTYTGDKIEPEVTVKDGDITIPSTEYEVIFTDNTNAGTATVTIKDKTGGNYIVSGSRTFEIEKAASAVTTAPVANTLTCNGKKQALIKAGIADGGTMQYRLGGSGEFSTNIPQAVDAGTYTIYYKVVGDSNHKDTDGTDFVTVTIKKAASTGKSEGSGSSGSKHHHSRSSDSGNSAGSTGTTTPTLPAAPAETPKTNPSTVKLPGTKTEAQTPAEETGAREPHIADDTGKSGWNLIKNELQDALKDVLQGKQDQSGDTVTVTVNMNGATVVPGDVFDSIKGQDINVVFDMGDGITWTVNGLDITADQVNDIDFSVTTGADAGQAIPVDVINNVTGERYSMNLSLIYDGAFGFQAVLTVNMDQKNAGLYANLFYYNEDSGDLEFICAGEIGSDGNVDLTFSHASDYVVVIDEQPMNVANAVDTNADALDTIDNAQQTGAVDGVSSQKSGNMIWIILLVIAVILAGAGIVLVQKGKKKEE